MAGHNKQPLCDVKPNWNLTDDMEAIINHHIIHKCTAYKKLNVIYSVISWSTHQELCWRLPYFSAQRALVQIDANVWQFSCPLLHRLHSDPRRASKNFWPRIFLFFHQRKLHKGTFSVEWIWELEEFYAWICVHFCAKLMGNSLGFLRYFYCKSESERGWNRLCMGCFVPALFAKL